MNAANVDLTSDKNYIALGLFVFIYNNHCLKIFSTKADAENHNDIVTCLLCYNFVKICAISACMGYVTADYNPLNDLLLLLK